MNCPSCAFLNPEDVLYCAHCRMSFNKFSLFLVHVREHLTWILRRTNAGFMSGLVAWFFIPALSRVLSAESTPMLHFIVTGLLGGAFLGTVDGMVEESTPKIIRGGIIGGMGGAIGGAIFGHFQAEMSADRILWGLFGFWGIAGGFIGSISALWEKKTHKIIVGILAGVLGGGLGGALAYSMFAFLIQEHDTGAWLSRRLYEGLSGGILGILMWFFIGAAERLVIFKRRPLGDAALKQCDHCSYKNPLSSWYCGQCGYILQVQAPAGKLNLSPFTTLDRLRQMFQFMGRLAITTGAIAGTIIFAVFVTETPILALIALLFMSILSYFLHLFFSSVAESLKILIKK